MAFLSAATVTFCVLSLADGASTAGLAPSTLDSVTVYSPGVRSFSEILPFSSVLTVLEYSFGPVILNSTPLIGLDVSTLPPASLAYFTISRLPVVSSSLKVAVSTSVEFLTVTFCVVPSVGNLTLGFDLLVLVSSTVYSPGAKSVSAILPSSSVVAVLEYPFGPVIVNSMPLIGLDVSTLPSASLAYFTTSRLPLVSLSLKVAVAVLVLSASTVTVWVLSAASGASTFGSASVTSDSVIRLHLIR